MPLVSARVHCSRVFWPRWLVQFNNGDRCPVEYSGPSRGQRPVLDHKGNFPKPSQPTTKFVPGADIMFIPNYVFEHCEDHRATIYYIPDDELPKVLTSIRHVAVHANCLSIAKDPDDDLWGKQLRFILCSFPNVETVILIATVVLDTTGPSACPLPYEIATIESIALSDRARLGIVDEREELKFYRSKAGLPAGDFTIQAWEDLEKAWPLWKRRREAVAQANQDIGVKPAPTLSLAALVFFAKEWLDVQKDGEHGKCCNIDEAQLNPAIRSALQAEKADRSGIIKTSSGTMYSTNMLKRQPFSNMRASSEAPSQEARRQHH